MPIGSISNLAPTIHDMQRAFAGSFGRLKIADLGVGFGIYGAAIRQWIDRGVAPYSTYVLGVEGFEQYRNPCWSLYDFIHVCPIEEWVEQRAQQDRFHAILMNDVLEHFERDAGLRMLASVKRLLEPRGRLYVTTPGVWMEQGSAYGNQFETHRSFWTSKDLEAIGFDVLDHFDGRTVDWAENRMLSVVFVSPESQTTVCP